MDFGCPHAQYASHTHSTLGARYEHAMGTLLYADIRWHRSAHALIRRGLRPFLSMHKNLSVRPPYEAHAKHTPRYAEDTLSTLCTRWAHGIRTLIHADERYAHVIVNVYYKSQCIGLKASLL